MKDEQITYKDLCSGECGKRLNWTQYVLIQAVSTNINITGNTLKEGPGRVGGGGLDVRSLTFAKTEWLFWLTYDPIWNGCFTVSMKHNQLMSHFNLVQYNQGIPDGEQNLEP
ncbi:hypothetical protein BVRB_3g066070 [Beta vulgaris subsp. vulgaris]|nr:hypothetical protein BVRB_3g066070 [Beta vulgaris subsp. vulgaris]